MPYTHELIHFMYISLHAKFSGYSQLIISSAEIANTNLIFICQLLGQKKQRIKNSKYGFFFFLYMYGTDKNGAQLANDELCDVATIDFVCGNYIT